MLRQLLKPFTRNVAQRGGRAYHAPAEFKPGTMDELPIPQGSWQQYYDNKQKSYNLQLAFGVVYFVSTMTYIISWSHLLELGSSRSQGSEEVNNPNIFQD